MLLQSTNKVSTTGGRIRQGAKKRGNQSGIDTQEIDINSIKMEGLAMSNAHSAWNRLLSRARNVWVVPQSRHKNKRASAFQIGTFA